VSLWDGDPCSTGYLTGRLESDGQGGLGFVPRAGGRLDQGRDFYAPAVLQEPDRALLWGWSWEARPQEEVLRAGWAGVLTAPRVVDVHPDGSLRVSPAPELDQLHPAEPFVTAPARVPLPLAYDLTVTACEPTTVSLLRDPAGRELTVRADPASGTVVLDRVAWPRTGREGSAPITVHVPKAPELTLRLLVDGSLLELFVADRSMVTERVYRSPDDIAELVVDGPGARVIGWAPDSGRRG
jgi:beta-fructofuranosidase